MLYKKSPNEHLKITLSWTAELAIDSATISTVTWTIPSGITSVSQTNAGSNTTLVLSGGVENVEYSIKCRIQTSQSTSYEQGILVQVVSSISQPTNCYASLFNVASDLGLTSESDVSKLAQTLAQTSRWIEDYTGRKFYLQTGISEYVKADNKSYLFVANYPLREITIITYQGEAVPTADYYIAGYDVSGIRSADNAWELYSKSSDNYYTIVYNAGFYLPGQANRDLPSDIEVTCEMIAKESWKAKDRDPTLSKMSIPQVITLEYRNAVANGTSKTPTLQYQAAQLLDKYKIWRF